MSEGSLVALPWDVLGQRSSQQELNALRNSKTETSESRDGSGSLRRLSEHENLTLGVATGVIETLGVQPVLYWKNSFIHGERFTLNPLLLYRGVCISTMNFAICTGIQFQSSGWLQKLVAEDATAKLSWKQESLCAFLGGALSGPFCSASELIMIQQQRFGGSIVSTWSRVLKTSGPLGVMRGLSTTTGREALYTAGYLGIVPVTQKYFSQTLGNDWIGSAVGAVGGGLVCAAITQPMDTAKTCMQGDIERKKYTTTLATLRKLRLEYGGVTAIYRGYWWRAVFVIFDFFALDFISKKLAPVMFPEKMMS